MRRLLEWGYGLYAALVLTVAIFVLGAPLMLATPGLKLRRRLGRWGVRTGLVGAFVPLRVHGLKHLPPGPCLVVSNHASYLDGPILTAALPERFTFVVQDGAGNWPVVGLIIRRMGVTFVNRSSPREGARLTRALIRRLADGESFAVFAEGTFVDAPGLLPFRNGAFLMAARANVPVVPAVIRGTRRLLGGGRRVLRRSAVRIDLFPPLQPGGTERAAVLELRDRARAVVLAHCGEPDAAEQL